MFNSNRDIKKKIFFSLMINSCLLYGDSLAEVSELIGNDTSKYDSLDTYGVVSLGFEEVNIDFLSDDIQAEKGIAKTINLNLFGYSLYAKTISNYDDFTIKSPKFDFGLYEADINANYKKFQYTGNKDSGELLFYSLGLSPKVKTFNSWGQPMTIAIDLPKVTLAKLDSKNKGSDTEYYSISMGGHMDIIEQALIYKLSQGRRLKYDYYISPFEGAGILVTYLKGKGSNLNYLMDSVDGKDSIGGYSYDLNPSIFLTFPIGYLRVGYRKSYAMYEALSSSGINASLAIVF